MMSQKVHRIWPYKKAILDHNWQIDRPGFAGWRKGGKWRGMMEVVWLKIGE